MQDENNTWRPHFKSLHSLSLSLSVLKKKCSKVYNDSILASFLNIDVIQPELLECIRTIPNLQFVHRCFVVVQHNFSVYKSGGRHFVFVTDRFLFSVLKWKSINRYCFFPCIYYYCNYNYN